METINITRNIGIWYVHRHVWYAVGVESKSRCSMPQPGLKIAQQLIYNLGKCTFAAILLARSRKFLNFYDKFLKEVPEG